MRLCVGTLSSASYRVLVTEAPSGACLVACLLAVRTVESGKHGVCSMKNGVRIKEYGVEYGGRRMKHGVQSLASGVWSAA